MKPEQEVLRKQVEEIQEVADTLDLEEGNTPSVRPSSKN